MARGRILLAHANTDCQLIYGSVLRHRGYSVDIAETVESALGQLAANHYDAVIADLYLRAPEATDDCLVRQIRLAPFGVHLPAVILTAWTTQVHQHLAREVGADRFLPLPATPRQLVDVIEELLEHSHPRLLPPAPSSDVQHRPVPNGC